jgi:hypothetical protein
LDPQSSARELGGDGTRGAGGAERQTDSARAPESRAAAMALARLCGKEERAALMLLRRISAPMEDVLVVAVVNREAAAVDRVALTSSAR